MKWDFVLGYSVLILWVVERNVEVNDKFDGTMERRRRSGEEEVEDQAGKG
jgi:hypothetical protein